MSGLRPRSASPRSCQAHAQQVDCRHDLMACWRQVATKAKLLSWTRTHALSLSPSCSTAKDPVELHSFSSRTFQKDDRSVPHLSDKAGQFAESASGRALQPQLGPSPSQAASDAIARQTSTCDFMPAPSRRFARRLWHSARMLSRRVEFKPRDVVVSHQAILKARAIMPRFCCNRLYQTSCPQPNLRNPNPPANQGSLRHFGGIAVGNRSRLKFGARPIPVYPAWNKNLRSSQKSQLITLL